MRLSNRARVQVAGLTAEITAVSLERMGLQEGDPAVATFKAMGTRLVPLGRPVSPPEPPPPPVPAPS